METRPSWQTTATPTTVTLEAYLALADELHIRYHMNHPIEPYNTQGIQATQQSHFMPGASRSMAVARPEPGEDLSHLNCPHFRKVQEGGRHPKPGNRSKKQ